MVLVTVNPSNHDGFVVNQKLLFFDLDLPHSHSARLALDHFAGGVTQRQDESVQVRLEGGKDVFLGRKTDEERDEGETSDSIDWLRPGDR